MVESERFRGQTEPKAEAFARMNAVKDPNQTPDFADRNLKVADIFPALA